MSDLVTETIQNLIELHSLEDELSRAKSGKTELQNRIDAVRVKLIPNVLGHHDRMRERGKKSIAEVRNRVCGGCHMMVATGILATLRHMEDIQLCANCGRYLYIVPETAAPEPAVETAPKSAKRKKGKTPKTDKSDG
jgi:predicted  nucleic acid-binding Zn-ribbon protein